MRMRCGGLKNASAKGLICIQLNQTGVTVDETIEDLFRQNSITFNTFAPSHEIDEKQENNAKSWKRG